MSEIKAPFNTGSAEHLIMDLDNIIRPLFFFFLNHKILIFLGRLESPSCTFIKSKPTKKYEPLTKRWATAWKSTALTVNKIEKWH